jgi:hypothetical protein
MSAPASDPAEHEHAVKLLALIPASARAHATYDPKTAKRNAKGKVEVEYKTVRAPVTVNCFRQHLAGTVALVVSLRCDEDTAAASVVDCDDLDVDVMATVLRIRALGVPLYVRRLRAAPHTSGPSTMCRLRRTKRLS